MVCFNFFVKYSIFWVKNGSEWGRPHTKMSVQWLLQQWEKTLLYEQGDGVMKKKGLINSISKREACVTDCAARWARPYSLQG